MVADGDFFSLSLVLLERFRGRESEKELEVLRLTRVNAFQTSKHEVYAVMSMRMLTARLLTLSVRDM